MFVLVIWLCIRSTKSRFSSEFINTPEELTLSGVCDGQRESVQTGKGEIYRGGYG